MKSIRISRKNFRFVFTVFFIVSYLILVSGLGVFLHNQYGVSYLMTFVLSLNLGVIGVVVYFLRSLGIKSYKRLRVPLFFLALIMAAELIFAYVDATQGLAFHILIALIALMSPFYLDKEGADIAHAFILVSLLRLINVGIPLEGISIYYQFLIIYSLLLLSITVYFFKQGIRLFDLGIRSGGVKMGVALGVSLGILLGFTEYSVLGVSKVFPTFFFASLSVFFILGLVEELIFRAVLINSMSSIDPFFALLLSSVAFGVMHSVWIKPLEYFFTFYAGLILAVIYYKTKSLVAPVVAHTVINFVLFQMIPFRIL